MILLPGTDPPLKWLNPPGDLWIKVVVTIEEIGPLEIGAQSWLVLYPLLLGGKNLEVGKKPNSHGKEEGKTNTMPF